MKKVAIIIPAAERRYIRAIDSVLAQNYNDIEIVVDDNGKAPNQLLTQKSAKCLTTNQIKYIVHENKNGSAARNGARNTDAEL